MIQFEPESIFEDAIKQMADDVETPLYGELVKIYKSLEFSSESKEAQMFQGLLMAFGALEASVNEQTYRMDEIDEDLAEVEGEFFGDAARGFDLNGLDGELFEMTCPGCQEKVYLDPSMLAQEKITCPNCGEKVDFEIDMGSCGGDCGGCGGCGE